MPSVFLPQADGDDSATSKLRIATSRTSKKCGRGLLSSAPLQSGVPIPEDPDGSFESQHAALHGPVYINGAYHRGRLRNTTELSGNFFIEFVRYLNTFTAYMIEHVNTFSQYVENLRAFHVLLQTPLLEELGFPQSRLQQTYSPDANSSVRVHVRACSLWISISRIEHYNNTPISESYPTGISASTKRLRGSASESGSIYQVLYIPLFKFTLNFREQYLDTYFFM